MGKIAFVFPGQGAQYAGMGKELAAYSPAAADIFRHADLLRPETSRQCFSGPEEELAETKNTQPCVLTAELAAAAALSAAGIRADMLAGHSLGELAAMIFSGALTYEEGFRLVCLRGELMQRDAEKSRSGMAAVLRLDADTVGRLCSQYAHVYPANDNCPGQIVVSGLEEELAAFCGDVKAAGGRALPLRVRGGFHSPLMAQAAAEFEKAAASLSFRKPAVPLYSNCTGQVYGDNFAELLGKQICTPVRWQDVVGSMIRDGADTFIEIGPGKTLCGLIGKIDASVRTLHVEDCESLEEAVREAAGC
ncbi:MAG: ACP S-malonyltransferase [Clostridiaceae bacterium]|nr:ACP S-malonyltransferase [Clostridiaceae bacterium]